MSPQVTLIASYGLLASVSHKQTHSSCCFSLSGYRHVGMCSARAILHIRCFLNSRVSDDFSRPRLQLQFGKDNKIVHNSKQVLTEECTFCLSLSLMPSLCYFISCLSVQKKALTWARPSSRRGALVSPVITHSTCSGSCRRRARSLTFSSISGSIITRSNLNGRMPTFTKNRRTQRIAFGELLFFQGYI